MYVFTNLDALIARLEQVAQDKRRLAGDQPKPPAGSLLLAEAYGIETAIAYLKDVRADSPALFTIPTEWAVTKEKVGGRTAQQLVDGYDPMVAERKKPWMVIRRKNGEVLDYFDTGGAAIAHIEYLGYEDAVIARNPGRRED